MASIVNDPNGRKRIQFVAPDGRRKTIRLGKVDRKTAERVCRHIEALLAAQITGQPVSRETAVWLDSIGKQLRDRIAATGLTTPGKPTMTLGQFVAEYLRARRDEVKRSTFIVLEQACRHLFRVIPPKTLLSRITPLDGDLVRKAMLEGRARATANKWTRIIRQLFNAARERGLIEQNPLGHIRGIAVVGDAARRYFVPAEEVRRVLEVIPCPQFRAIVALARWGGLRVPSEVLNLTWQDVDFERGRILVRSPKTAHHAQQGIRVVPLFAELRPFLEELRQAAGNCQHLITRYRDPGVNLRTQLGRWCAEAGVKLWPKPFQNMRATRATELADRFPSHVCAQWLGHSERIADQFYRSVTDEHFLRAVLGDAALIQAAQKAAQSDADRSGLTRIGEDNFALKTAANIEEGRVLEACSLGAAGPEQHARIPVKSVIAAPSDAETDARLLLLEAWRHVDLSLQAHLLALLKSLRPDH
jgi:integrase